VCVNNIDVFQRLSKRRAKRADDTARVAAVLQEVYASPEVVDCDDSRDYVVYSGVGFMQSLNTERGPAPVA